MITFYMRISGVPCMARLVSVADRPSVITGNKSFGPEMKFELYRMNGKRAVCLERHVSQDEQSTLENEASIRLGVKS